MCRNRALFRSRFYRCTGLSFALLLVLALAPAGLAQTPPGPSRPLITQRINNANTVVLAGNTRPEAKNPANDRGIAPDSLPLQHMLLQLRRPTAQEQALEALINQLHDPKSPNYHHWLSAEEFGAQFGPAQSDIQTIAGWLERQGFAVNVVYPSRMAIDFSGTAGQVRSSFRTEIHYLNVRGVTRFANISDPQIPAVLAPAVVGIVALHNIPPKPMYRAKTQFTIIHCRGPIITKHCYAVTPPDLATIYNFNQAFNAGFSGKGQTIYLIEDSDLSTDKDWTTFRSAFGLSAYRTATLNTIHPAPPSGSNNCSDPEVNGDEIEATIDAEYASAAAPDAALVIASCGSKAVTFGGLIAIQNLVNAKAPPAIVSLSYGECETQNGAAANAAYNSAYQQGVAAGVSIFVSSGDSDADGCDQSENQVANWGIGVNALASTPYNVAVGGTDFGDGYAGTTSSYWNAINTKHHGSARSYIPEIPWNNSCANSLIANYFKQPITYGSSGFCNIEEGLGKVFWLNFVGGSGGPSGCATGAPSPLTREVVSGTCAGYAKPAWQSGVLGNPADGVRDLPDVSLFAANGIWNHYYLVCFFCTGEHLEKWAGYGGTSFAAPIWAGIQALINEKIGEKQGLPNVRLYQLASQEYGTSASSSCNSSNGNGIGSFCIFYDVTLGDNGAVCVTNSANCYAPSGSYGVLSTSTSWFAPAYAASPGWDFATGIGTVNVYNLVMAW